MKYMVLLGDGMADFPLAELDGRTPLEVADTPAMDSVARRGLAGLFCPIPDGMPPGSDIGNLSVFGYDPRTTYTGRAPLEAASQGIALEPGEVAFRCNLVTLQNGMMGSFTAGHISTEEAAELVAALNQAHGDCPVTFHPGVSYRHLAILRAGVDIAGDVVCTPPHDISDQAYAAYLPEGPGSGPIRELMTRSQAVLADHPVNRTRVDADLLPATSIWLWGQGRPPEIASYYTLFRVTGAVISAVDLVKGIGVCAGLDAPAIPGATGYLDTDYAAKVNAAFNVLQGNDFVYLHVEAPDEAAHEGRIDLKIQAIEDFDRNVVAPCAARIGELGAFRLLVAPDHVTAISTRTHAAGAVPFAVCGTGVAPCGAEGFSESAAEATGVFIEDGHRLLPAVLRTPTLTAAGLTQACA